MRIGVSRRVIPRTNRHNSRRFVCQTTLGNRAWAEKHHQPTGGPVDRRRSTQIHPQAVYTVCGKPRGQSGGQPRGQAVDKPVDDQPALWESVGCPQVPTDRAPEIHSGSTPSYRSSPAKTAVFHTMHNTYYYDDSYLLERKKINIGMGITGFSPGTSHPIQHTQQLPGGIA